MEPADGLLQHGSIDEAHLVVEEAVEGFEEAIDYDPEHGISTLEFDRFELDGTRIGALASEMTPEEFQHWAQVKLPALDDALENGVKPSTILKLLRAKVEKGLQEGTEPKDLSLENLHFASAYLEHGLQQPETRLRHFNERYRDYAQLLDRCQTRQEVIDVSAHIRRDNTNIGLSHGKLPGDPQQQGALTAKELQILFTEQSPRHYTSEMILAKLNYAGDGHAQKRRTDALLKGEIAASPEAQRLIDSLESRMGRRYADESLSATKHFLQSLKTPNSELRFKNAFDHSELYHKLPPAERDYVYQRATEQKSRLETASRIAPEQEGKQARSVVKELQDVLKAELLAMSISNADPKEIKDSIATVLEQYLEKGNDESPIRRIEEISRELSEVVAGPMRTIRPNERGPSNANLSERMGQLAVDRDRAPIYTR